MTSISVREDETYLILATESAVLEERDVKQLLEALRSRRIKGKSVVLDLRATRQIAMPALRTLTRAAGNVTQDDAVLAVVADVELTLFIREQGLDRLLTCYTDVQQALKSTGALAAGNRTTEFLNTVLEAVQHTLSVMAGTQATPGKSFLRSEAPKLTPDVAGIIGIVSNPFNGSLVLAFPVSTYLGVMSRMMGAEYREITPDIQDGAAELLNMVVGQAKTLLNRNGFDLKQAIPTVICGKDFQVAPGNGKPSIVVPYTSDAGEFYVELTVNSDIRPIA